ncbi:DNA-binding transcriptional regulator, AcrR family [Catalinimonas alkaloidigena]|uniref:DNA-binding transcriptional regulator, AcrR family n=1 Tax=Catalinimonas alkaloidigena TaxID=1075417 RepID=A0A1G9B1C1_9BACT|nr:TetR/AcrR family transcriptional regulator [Catalinimonas alkaloidigena]SDK33381.1 DNA-binding transcriptional regulator, AcrR family [Catalinimonas alkaloidigena]
MPQPTFLHLPDTKQDSIRQAGLEEFALNAYDSASITRIVKTLKIAKGSIYQYFQNKSDFYQYLFDYARDTRAQALESVSVPDDYKDWFKWLEMYLEKRVQFDLTHPVISGLLRMAFRERFSEEVGELIRQHRAELLQWHQDLLRKQQTDKKINKKIKVKHAALLALQLTEGLTELLVLQHDLDLAAHMQSNEPITDVSEKEIRKTVKGLVKMLKRGLQ